MKKLIIFLVLIVSIILCGCNGYTDSSITSSKTDQSAFSFSSSQEDNLEIVDTFYIKAVGVTFDGRQDKIKKLKQNQQLYLLPEPTNTYDKNAILITTESGEDIGYISKDYNKVFLDKMNQGYTYNLYVAEITGVDQYPNLGVNIKVECLK